MSCTSLTRYVGYDGGDAPHGFGPPLSEHHPCVRTQVFGVLDEPEQTAGLVSCTQVLSVHCQNRGRLSSAATVYCGKREGLSEHAHACTCEILAARGSV